MIDQGLIVPLTHPVTMNLVSEKLGGDAMTPDKQGFYPNWSGCVCAHLTKKLALTETSVPGPSRGHPVRNSA